MTQGSETPKRGTRAWAQNEKLINNNPVLKQLRNVSEGLSNTSHNGITSAPSEQYKSNYDRIDWSKRRDD